MMMSPDDIFPIPVDLHWVGDPDYSEVKMDLWWKSAGEKQQDADVIGFGS